MTEKALFSIKTDKKLKKEAQAVAKELGLPLSMVINQYLRQFVKERQISFSLEPNEKTKRKLDRALRDIKRNKNYSGPFHSWSEVKSHLDTLKK